MGQVPQAPATSNRFLRFGWVSKDHDRPHSSWRLSYTLCDREPEPYVTVTTVTLDTDYLIDQVRWLHAGVLQDRLDA